MHSFIDHLQIPLVVPLHDILEMALNAYTAFLSTLSSHQGCGVLLRAVYP
jgi:hypothetical protein